MPHHLHGNKQLLDEVFVISRTITVEVGVISRSQRLRLITLAETLIIQDITKTESNNSFMAGLQCHAIKNKNLNHSINEIKKLGYDR